MRVRQFETALFALLLGSVSTELAAGDESLFRRHLPPAIPTVSAVELKEAEPFTYKWPDSWVSPKTAKVHLSAVASAQDLRLRGPVSVGIFRRVAPSVVLVVTEDGIGSGTVIDDVGSILTNWHVVGDVKEVGVIYKPQRRGTDPKRADLRRARVVRIDEVADLALIKVSHPNMKASPVRIADAGFIAVGDNVHAIGHPTGKSWTYTGGFVSQVRESYEWQTESEVAHKANVIQTQTPINPGNSGGPLLNDSAQLVGVNAFISDGEGLNFAIDASEVRAFLARDASRFAERVDSETHRSVETACVSRVVTEERTRDGLGVVKWIDRDCDGRIDSFFFRPDDPADPDVAALDTTGDGEFDTLLFDDDRDGGVDRSLYDTDGDGKADLAGFHLNGNSTPYGYEPYVDK